MSAPRKVLLLGVAAVFPGVVAKWGGPTLVLGWLAGPLVLLGCGVVLVLGRQTVGRWSLRRLVFVAVGLTCRTGMASAHETQYAGAARCVALMSPRPPIARDR